MIQEPDDKYLYQFIMLKLKDENDAFLCYVISRNAPHCFAECVRRYQLMDITTGSEFAMYRSALDQCAKLLPLESQIIMKLAIEQQRKLKNL